MSISQCIILAQICSSPPSQGQQCGSVNTERYYFNIVSRSCTTFTYQGCDTSGNNFGTLAQCQNYCNSAGMLLCFFCVFLSFFVCAVGEVVFVDPNTQAPRQCNQQLSNSCPTGYTCRYDSLTQNSVCCGATSAGLLFCDIEDVIIYA